jgi:hypothetical protein
MHSNTPISNKNKYTTHNLVYAAVNKQTSSRFVTIITIAFTLAFASIMNEYYYVNMAYAKHLSNQDRYISGWDQGIADCRKGPTVINKHMYIVVIVIHIIKDIRKH